MLILTCILILKYWGQKYRGLSAILVVAILLLLIFLIKKIYFFLEARVNIPETQEWINIQNFSNKLEMDKEGKLNSYPEITILSDVDGEVLSLNVTTGDIVDEYQILMQIRDVNGNSSNNNMDEMILNMYENYYELDQEYKEFKIEYGDEINKLEQELINNQNALIQAIEFRDNESRALLEKEIKDNSMKLNLLKSQREDLRNGVRDLESEIGLMRNESDKYYYETEKQTPRSPFNGIIGNIYVNEGEVVRNGDELITVINNNFTPEISVGLDFDEYILTKDLTDVDIFIENENWGDFNYKGEIYTRSPILNNEGKYTVTVKITDEDVLDLILNDENSKITVLFNIDSTSEWMPLRCFKEVGKYNGVITTYNGEEITEKQIGIKSKWNDWINVESFVLSSLEKYEEKDGINGSVIEVLCDIE